MDESALPAGPSAGYYTDVKVFTSLMSAHACRMSLCVY